MIIAAFALPVAAWSRTQHRNTGRFVLISDKSDVNLRIGNNPNANGTYYLQLRELANPSAWSYIRAEPADSLRLAGRKLLYFWGVLRAPWTVPHPAVPMVSRAVHNEVPYEWTVAFVRGGAVLALFVAGVVVIGRRRSIWPVPAAVIGIMAVHVVYFASHRFSIPVWGQICIVAAAAVAALARGLVRTRRRRIFAMVTLAWILFAQRLWVPGLYTVEGEDLEGIAAVNTADVLAANGTARFAPVAGGARPVAFLSGEAVPRGSFVVRVRARASDCGNTSAPAVILDVHRETAAARTRDTFTVRDICRGDGYGVLLLPGTLRKDDVLSVAVLTSSTVEVWIDRVDILFGYKRRGQVPLGDD